MVGWFVGWIAVFWVLLGVASLACCWSVSGGFLGFGFLWVGVIYFVAVEVALAWCCWGGFGVGAALWGSGGDVVLLC